MKKLTLSLCFAYLQSAPSTSLADGADAINAERPGFSSSPTPLAVSALQIESGYQYTRDSGRRDTDDHTLPLLLFRVGLIERLELQLGWSGYSWTDVGPRDVDGVNDASIGMKWQVTGQEATVPLALFAGLSIPVGDDELSSNEADPSLGAFWSYSSGLDWFGTLLITDADRDISLGNAIGVSLPVGTHTGAYLEYFGNYGGGSAPEHYLNGGFTYLPRLDLQLDLHGGVGLNGRAADFFLGFGVAYRF